MVRQMKKSPDFYWTQLAQIRLIRSSDETEFDLRQFSSHIDWTNLFGNCNPVQIEVGCGKGRFLTESCKRNPDTNFIGIENSWKYVLRTKERLKKHGQTNACISYVDAPYFVHHYVADHSVEAYHVYFPDPWWKKRHRSRIVMNERFLLDIQRVLVDGGQLNFWTDVAEYFEATIALIRQVTQLVGPYEVAESVPQHDLDYRTHFERRMRLQGEPVYRSSFEKVATV